MHSTILLCVSLCSRNEIHYPDSQSCYIPPPLSLQSTSCLDPLSLWKLFPNFIRKLYNDDSSWQFTKTWDKCQHWGPANLQGGFALTIHFGVEDNQADWNHKCWKREHSCLQHAEKLLLMKEKKKKHDINQIQNAL